MQTLNPKPTLGLYTLLYSTSSAALGVLLRAAALERTRTPASCFLSWTGCLRCCRFSCFDRLQICHPF